MANNVVRESEWRFGMRQLLGFMTLPRDWRLLIVATMTLALLLICAAAGAALAVKKLARLIPGLVERLIVWSLALPIAVAFEALWRLMLIRERLAQIAPRRRLRDPQRARDLGDG